MRTAAYLLALAFVASTVGSAQNRDLVGARFDARVVAVIDGDTVDAIPAGEKRAIRVRLDGVDAPERGEAFSDKARVFVRVLLFDQSVRVEGRSVDRYGRLVARIVAAGKDASVELASAGLACHYTRYSSDLVLASAQADARRAGRGFWSSNASKPRCATPEDPSIKHPAAMPRAAEGKFHGNTSSRVYHTGSCRNYNCRNCTRVFGSSAEADAAGYRPAGDCLAP